MKEVLRIAVQKKGRLNDKSMALLKECGISISNGGGKLMARASNFPVEILYLRDDDIPQYVKEKVADVGIVGENVLIEKGPANLLQTPLGFSKCRLSLAVRREEAYTGLSYFEGKRIATSYPRILGEYLQKNSIKAEVETISGSVEIAPGIGLAEGICDIVSTGSTLLSNGLKEVETVMRSEATLISNPGMGEAQQTILKKLLFRIQAVQNAQRNKYILLNAPNQALEKISALLPGMKSPTVLPLQKEGWSSLHSVVREDDFWDVIDELQVLGAEGILVVPIEKMVV